MRWKYRKMVKPQERLFMQSKRLHKESFLWNDLFHDKNKSEPIANRRKVRIYSLWWRRRGSNSRPYGCEPYALPAELRPRRINIISSFFVFVYTKFGLFPKNFLFPKETQRLYGLSFVRNSKNTKYTSIGWFILFCAKSCLIALYCFNRRLKTLQNLRKFR